MVIIVVPNVGRRVLYMTGDRNSYRLVEHGAGDGQQFVWKTGGGRDGWRENANTVHWMGEKRSGGRTENGERLVGRQSSRGVGV